MSTQRLLAELYGGLRRFAALVALMDVEPDDVLLSALVNVLRTRRLHTLDNPEAYVRRAIVNQVAAELRLRRTRRTILRRLRPAAGEQTGVAYPSDIDELMRLQPIERAVLYLHDILGTPFDEVAGAVGISVGNARVIASRARRRLKAELLEEDS